MSGTSDWTDISNSNIDQDSPATETLFQAIRDNINAAQWNYYDDGDGLIYNSAVDGSVVSVVSPDFEDGYEYAFMFSPDIATVSNDVIRMELYWETDASYFIYKNITNSFGFPTTSLEIVRFPRMGLGFLPKDGTTGFSSSTSTDKILRARFINTSVPENIDTGKIWMFRRHVNV